MCFLHGRVCKSILKGVGYHNYFVLLLHPCACAALLVIIVVHMTHTDDDLFWSSSLYRAFRHCESQLPGGKLPGQDQHDLCPLTKLCVVFSNGVLPSSCGGQQRAMATASTEIPRIWVQLSNTWRRDLYLSIHGFFGGRFSPVRKPNELFYINIIYHSFILYMTMNLLYIHICGHRAYSIRWIRYIFIICIIWRLKWFSICCFQTSLMLVLLIPYSALNSNPSTHLHLPPH